jgi:hypothetical protein
MKIMNCPSCGATIRFQSAASVMAICEFCKSTLVRHDLNLEDVGKMAELQTDGSTLQLRVEGKYSGVHFAVIGRIQLRFEQGLWNEWYLLFDDMRNGWLGEAQGTYAISSLVQVKESIPHFEDMVVGKKLQLNRQWYEVQDVEKAVCIGGEGELPFRVGQGYVAPVVDLMGADSFFSTLDYSEVPPLVFLGKYVDFNELQLSGLRELDGW